MAGSFRDYFEKVGINVDIDDPIDAANSTEAASNRARVTEKIRNHVIGYDAVTGDAVHIDEHAARGLYDSVVGKDGKPKASSMNIGDKWEDDETYKIKKGLENDFKRSQGQHAGYGLHSGYSMGVGGYRRASSDDLLRSVYRDGAGAAWENSLNSLGIATAQQKRQWRNGGLLAKAGAAAGPVLGAATIFSTIVNGDDMYETMTFNAGVAAGMTGFTVGNRIGGGIFNGAEITKNDVTGRNVLKGGKMRFVGGAIGGATGFLTGAAIVGGGMWAAGDLTSNNSVLASMARGYAKLPSNANIQQNNRTLTMRQQALQQLSQSAMNDRASLLGNEAAVLRGVL